MTEAGKKKMFFKKVIKKIAKKQNNRGLSIAEMLISVLILLFVSGGLVTTVIIARAQYKEAMRHSEAKMLCATIANLIVDELTNTPVIEPVGSDVYYDSVRFSGRYCFQSNEKGQIVMKNRKAGEPSKPLLSDAAYTNDLKTKVEIKYDGKRTFEAVVIIYATSDGFDNVYARSSFAVINVASV